MLRELLQVMLILLMLREFSPRLWIDFHDVKRIIAVADYRLILLMLREFNTHQCVNSLLEYTFPHHEARDAQRERVAARTWSGGRTNVGRTSTATPTNNEQQ